MHTQKRKIFTLIGLIILFALGCEKLQNLRLAPKKKMVEPQGIIIAKVGDLSITLEQLEQEINNYNELIGSPEARLSTREQKIAYLNEELIRRHLFYLEAKAKRLEEQPKTQELLQNLEINVLANQVMQEEIGSLTVT